MKKYITISLLLICSVCYSQLYGQLLGNQNQLSYGYCVDVMALTSSPADAATTYIGNNPKAPTTTAGLNKIFIRFRSQIIGAEIFCNSGTAGTAENWSLYIRVNNTTDYLIQTVGIASGQRSFSNWSMNIQLNANDYFEVKMVNPTWVTNPLTTTFGGYVFISPN